MVIDTASSGIDRGDLRQGDSDAKNQEADQDPAPDDIGGATSRERVVEGGTQTIRHRRQDEAHERDVPDGPVASQLRLVAQVLQRLVCDRSADPCLNIGRYPRWAAHLRHDWMVVAYNESRCSGGGGLGMAVGFEEEMSLWFVCCCCFFFLARKGPYIRFSSIKREKKKAQQDQEQTDPVGETNATERRPKWKRRFSAGFLVFFLTFFFWRFRYVFRAANHSTRPVPLSALMPGLSGSHLNEPVRMTCILRS